MAYGARTSFNPVHAILAIASAVLILLMAAGPGASQAQASSACQKWGKKQANQITVGHARRAVMCLVNAERGQRGLRKLDHSKKLQRASQRHSNVMQQKKCFSHVCPGERSLSGRLSGVSYLVNGLSSYAYGENIGWGANNHSTPKNMVKAWMNSSGHRANILDPRFRDFGVGYTKGDYRSKRANAAFFTTDFGRRKG